MGGQDAHWVTYKEGENELAVKAVIPGGKIVLSELEKERYLLLLSKDAGGGEPFHPDTPITEDLTLYVQWVKSLPNPPAGEAGRIFQVVMEDGVSEVPPALAGHETLGTAGGITSFLKTEVTKGGVSEDHTAVYDVELMVSNDGGGTWEKATADNFPNSGRLTVTLPYPEGTDQTYTFTVVHMFTTTDFGKKIGGTETINDVEKVGDMGIRFTITGLSPISVGWTEPKPAPSTPDIPDIPNVPITPSTPGTSSGYDDGDDDDDGGYAVTLKKANHGGVTIDRRNTPKGTAVTITAVPDEGYVLDALRWAAENGILNGYGGGRLHPKRLATRAQTAAVLQRYLEREEDPR